MLLACHERIRSFTAIASRLAEVQDAAPAEVANAAAGVHRYYTVALPLHEADENESLYPRLRRVLQDGTSRAAELMVEQHGPIDVTVAALVPLWDELQRCPEKLAQLRPELGRLAARLQELWREHLALEEEVVFPLIRRTLSAEDLEAIHREMKQRRGVALE
jgi:hemerythrin-like domain-containing protein